LGQNFAKAYGVQFQNRAGELEYAYATSWGVSTRLIGGVIMTHGDDKGLRVPPALAPHQVVIVPIYRSEDEHASVMAVVERVRAALTGVRVKVDDRDNLRPGFKFNEWELKGVPLRIELGPKDVAADQVVIARRDTGDKQTVNTAEATARIPGLLDEIQQSLYDDALRFREAHTFEPKDFGEFKSLLAEPGGFLQGNWCGDGACEAAVKAETKATIRCLPMENDQATGDCLHCGNPGAHRATWALSY
jgi:prolyl-tRNA synthetase